MRTLTLSSFCSALPVLCTVVTLTGLGPACASGDERQGESADSVANTNSLADAGEHTQVSDQDASGPGDDDDGADSLDSLTPEEEDGSDLTDADDSDDDDEDPRFDLAVPDANHTGGSGGDDELCEGVDFLFVIDDSISMKPYQQQLAQAFPGFVDKIVEALPRGTSVHVGVTTTSFSPRNPGSDSAMACVSTNSEDVILDFYEQPTDIVNDLNGGQGRLFMHDGQAYFDGKLGIDDEALKAWFSGAAVAPGDQGCTLEMMTAAAGWAAHPANAATNAGFIRDEGSVLVIFLLSDEHDKSPGDPQQYLDMIAKAKRGCGGLDCVIGAGLLEQECYEHVNAPKMKSFLDALNAGQTIVGEIKCDPGMDCDYPAVVGDALAGVILETCKSIDPPE